MLYIVLTFLGPHETLSSMFIPGKHKSDLGDNLNNFLVNHESPIFLDSVKELLEFLSGQF